jgi:hypothetical protein
MYVMYAKTQFIYNLSIMPAGIILSRQFSKAANYSSDLSRWNYPICITDNDLVFFLSDNILDMNISLTRALYMAVWL